MAIERIVPGTIEWDAYYANHIVRYKFADEHLNNTSSDKVIDGATGVGYGAHFLAKKSSRTIDAIDISEVALSTANKYFKKDNLTFQFGNCEELLKYFGIATKDAIVSFETFEHLKKPILFLQEAGKVLKPNGSLILSSPNGSVTSPDGIVDWEFHEKEYMASELHQMLLENNFTDIEWYGQDYTEIGMLRQQFRAELNRLHSNPFNRIGKFLQRIFRNVKYKAILPEQELDFVIKKYGSYEEIMEEGTNGPFVILVVCKTKG